MNISDTVYEQVKNNLTNAEDIYESEMFEKFKYEIKIYDLMILIMGILITTINCAVVVSSGLILKNNQTRQTTYMFLGNVALTDMITGLALIVEYWCPMGCHGHYICVVQLGIVVSSTLIAVFSVGLIAVDRFLFIIHGLHYRKWVSPSRSKIAIITTWLFGYFIGFLPTFGWHHDLYDGKWCWFVTVTPKALIILTVTLAMIPIALVIILYSIILYYALRKIIQLQETSKATVMTNPPTLRMFRGKCQLVECVPNPHQQTKNGPSKWKAIKVVLFTSGAFVITWCPYFFVMIYFVFRGPEAEADVPFHMTITNPLAIWGYTNCLINPLIYAWWHKGFRAFIKKELFEKRINRILERIRISGAQHGYVNEIVPADSN